MGIHKIKKSRSNGSATVVNGYIYVAGGEYWDRTDNCYTLKSVERYDPIRDEWEDLPSMKYERINFALVHSNGFLYAFGAEGSDKGAEKIGRFDLSTSRWSEVRAQLVEFFLASYLLLLETNFRLNLLASVLI